MIVINESDRIGFKEIIEFKNKYFPNIDKGSRDHHLMSNTFLIILLILVLIMIIYKWVYHNNLNIK